MSDYLPPAQGWVRDQLETIDAHGGDTSVVDVHGRPVVVITMRGARSGKLRRVPLMRVEHDGVYLAVASKGGAPKDPEWVHNLRADPEVEVHDGTAHHRATARLLGDDERADWWQRAVEAFPSYADYQRSTERTIPLWVLEPR